MPSRVVSVRGDAHQKLGRDLITGRFCNHDEIVAPEGQIGLFQLPPNSFTIRPAAVERMEDSLTVLVPRSVKFARRTYVDMLPSPFRTFE